MGMAKAVNSRIEDGQTSQGFYVAASDGKGYGFNNNRSVERVLGLLDKGRQAHAGFVGDGVRIQAASTKVPADVSVVRVFTRVRPVPEGAAASNRNVARDHLWITPDDLKAITSGGNLQTLFTRIARFHLVDNVRGEPDMWSRADVRNLTSSSVKEGDAYRLTGKFSMSTPEGRRGMEATLDAWVTIDQATWKITRFLAHAEATAWGRGTYTPNPPEGKFSMVFAMVEADDAIARRVPPQGALWGNDYR